MNVKAVLTVSAIYLAVLGVGFMLFPQKIGIDAVPADASPALIAYLRIFGGPCLGIAVLNWLTRNAEPSATRNAMFPMGIYEISLGFWLLFRGMKPIMS